MLTARAVTLSRSVHPQQRMGDHLSVSRERSACGSDGGRLSYLQVPHPIRARPQPAARCFLCIGLGLVGGRASERAIDGTFSASATSRVGRANRRRTCRQLIVRKSPHREANVAAVDDGLFDRSMTRTIPAHCAKSEICMWTSAQRCDSQREPETEACGIYADRAPKIGHRTGIWMKAILSKLQKH